MSEPIPLSLATAVLRVPAPERALLIGCGDGEPALFLAREFPSARIRAIDPSAATVAAAQGRVGLDPEGRVAFKRADSTELPYPDDFFDLVAQLDGRVAVAEVARVLRDGGHFISAPPPRPRLGADAREKLFQARLRRQGIVVERVEAVGNGKFTVARLNRTR
jgi:SAM-dependent methyltransferase